MPCLNQETKDALIEAIDKAKIPPMEAEALAEFVESMQKCTVEETPKGRAGKRPLSKYNIFMSGCLKSGDMKSCVGQWREKKKVGG